MGAEKTTARFEKPLWPSGHFMFSRVSCVRLEAEHNLRIRHCLMALPGSKKARDVSTDFVF